MRVVSPLHHITVSPSSVTLNVGDSESFTATGYDARGNVVPIEPTWSVTGNIGTIDSDGSFLATNPGTGFVRATDSGITGSASVTVESPITITISADPTAIEPTGAGSNNTSTITVTATENNQPMSGVSVSLTVTAVQYSGGHQHNSSRPVGTLSRDSGSTGSDGTFQTTYIASKFGGQETITATAEGQTASVTLDVRVPGLSQLTDGTGYELTGETSAHPSNHYGTSTTNSALKGIARDFERAYSEEPDLGYNDMSLVKGGLFDIGPPYGQLWHPPHSAHRTGKNCDLDNIDEGMGHLDKLEDFIKRPPYNGHVTKKSDHWHLTFQ